MGKDGSLARKIGGMAPWILLLGALLLIAAYFIPYASATEEFRATLSAVSDSVSMRSIGLTADEAADVSLFNYARGMFALTSSISTAEVYAWLYVAMGVISAVTLLLAVLRKPLGAALFAALACAMNVFFMADFEKRNVIPSLNYEWGPARLVYVAAVAVIIISAVLFIIEKRQSR